MNHFRNQQIRTIFWNHKFWLCLMISMLMMTGYTRALGADMTSVIVEKLQTGGNGLVKWICLVCMIQFINYFTKFISAYSCTVIQKKLEVSLREQILRTLQSITFAGFENIDHGVIQTIMRKDVESAAFYVYVIFSRIGVSATTLVFTAFFMCRIDFLTTIAVLFIAITFGFLNRRVLSRLKELNLNTRKASANLSKVVTNTFEARDSVKVYQADDFVKNRFIKERHHINKASMDTAKIDSVRVGIYTIVNNIMLYGSALLLSALSIAGRNDLSQVVAYISLSTQALVAVEMIFRWMANVVGCNAAWERVGTILQMEVPEDQENSKEIAHVDVLSAENIGFRYKDSDWIFKDCNFFVQKGDILEIIGKSGSGKSTMFKCLLGLYRLDSGCIKINGKSENEKNLRTAFGFVPAQSTFYSDTIYNNITLGDHRISKETCLKNAERLGIKEWIDSIGLDYKLQENGGNLSGGQKQILSILRAVNLDRPVIILDEPFASLDSDKRSILMKFFEEYRRDHIIIFTSHIDNNVQVDSVKLILKR